MSHASAGPRVIPSPATPPLGTGAARALVLGAGGEYFAAWMAGYLHTLDTAGVDVSSADVGVGTSAGSLVGSALTGGHLRRLAYEFDLFAHFPSFRGKLAHQAPPCVVASRDLRGRPTPVHSETCSEARSALSAPSTV